MGDNKCTDLTNDLLTRYEKYKLMDKQKSYDVANDWIITGCSALIFAVLENDKKVVEHILKLNDCVDDISCSLMVAVLKSSKLDHEIIRLLINSGAKLDYKNDDNWTPLMMAARYSNRESTEEVVEILIKSGANLNLKNKAGNTALDLAVKYSNTQSTQKTVEMLINGGADVALNDNTVSMLSKGLLCKIYDLKIKKLESDVEKVQKSEYKRAFNDFSILMKSLAA